MSINPLASLIAFVLAFLVYAVALARTRERRIATLAAIAGWAIAFALVRLAYSGWQWNEQRRVDAHRQHVATVLERDPAFAAMKQYDADTYKNILAGISARPTLQTGDDVALLYEARHEINFTLGLDTRLKRASDDAVTAYAAALVDASDELATRDVDACVRYLYPRVDDKDNFSERLSVAAREADAAALAEVIKSAKVAPQKTTEDYEASQLALPVVDALMRQYGSDWQMLDAPYARDRDTGKLCRISIAFYRGVLRLRTESAAKILRYHVRRHG